MDTMKLEECIETEQLLKLYFDKYLCASFSNNKDIKINPDFNGKLIYKDSTGCSGSNAVNDIYILKNNKYVVITEYEYQNENIIKTQYCNNLCEVGDNLINSCFHDPNSFGKIGTYQPVYEIDNIPFSDRYGKKWVDFSRCYGKTYKNLNEVIYYYFINK